MRFGMGIHGRRWGKGSRRPGQAMVEMALVMMLLLILSFGIADFGLLTYRYVQAANCVREVARQAAVRKDLPAESFCIDSGLQSAVVVTPADFKTAEAGTPVTASLEVDHDWIAIGSLVPGLGASFPIRASETMRIEGQIKT